MKLRNLRIRRHHVPHVCAGLFALVMLLGSSGPLFVSSSVGAEQLQSRSLTLSDPTISATDVKFDFGFTTNTSGPIGSISFSICSNYLYEPTDPCTSPSGFDGTAAGLTNQTGVTDFSMHSSSTSNVWVLSRPAATNVSSQALTYEFSNLVNPDYIGSIYVRIATFATTDGSGPETDYGTVLTATTENITITTEVPPYLLFCVGVTIDGYNCGTATGGFLSFGELSRTQPRAATSQMLASTNAPYGYSVTLAGSTMTAGNNVIPAMSGGPSVPGTSQFGLNARANSIPGIGNDPEGPGLTMPSAAYNSPNNYRFRSGEIIVSSNTTDDYRKHTVSYIVNRDSQQPPGRYVATISYICLANF